jgi:hypothetical protein
MSFTYVSRGIWADLLTDGVIYRLVCKRCGRHWETADKGQAQIHATNLNSAAHCRQPQP